MILIIIILIILLLLSIAFFTLADRKFMAAIQRRLGPNIIGFKGLFQPLADGGKLFGKQIIFINHANLLLFQFSPIFILSIAFFNWTLIPVFMSIENGTIFNLTAINFVGNKNLLFIFFILSTSTLSFLSAGWASFSKYATMGGIRGANQALGYELIISFVILILIFLNKGFSLESFLITQTLNTSYFSLHFDLFLIFWFSVLAETGRVPFDLPESESELVAGYFTEYSGFLFAFYFLAEYSNMIFSSSLISIIFFKGWFSIPFINSFYFSYNYLKYFSLIFVFLLLFSLHRAILARIRIDQLFYLNWKIFMPILTSSFSFSLFSISFFKLYFYV
jgi:NADH-quinone oxidoreductase subunit H